MSRKVALVFSGVCVGLALAGCGGKAESEAPVRRTTEPVFSAPQVRRAFLAHGIRLVRHSPIPAGYIGSDFPRPSTVISNADPVQYDSPEAGAVFRVEIFGSVVSAETSPVVTVTSTWSNDPLPAPAFVRRRNVRVIYDSRRPVIRRKVMRALDSLV